MTGTGVWVLRGGWSASGGGWGHRQRTAFTHLPGCHVIQRERPQPLPAVSRAVPGRQGRPAGRRWPAGRRPVPAAFSLPCADCSTVRCADAR
jgi:hypothetical protein